MELKNKRIILTGASGGIGSALLRELSGEGAEVIGIARDGVDREYVCNFADRQELNSLIVKLNKLGRIDILINAAGVGIYKKLEDLNSDEWDESMAVNLDSVFLLTKALVGQLGKNPESLVLNIGSGAGVMPIKGRAAYCSSKFGLRGLTLTLAEEFDGRSPDFCLITLGSTLTEFGPLTLKEKLEKQQRGDAYFTPEWVADKLVEIIKNGERESEYTFFPGEYGFGNWKKP